VERTFKMDPRLLSYAPQVKVEKGTVLLTGDVGVLSAKEAAERDARHTIGVRKGRRHPGCSQRQTRIWIRRSQ